MPYRRVKKVEKYTEDMWRDTKTEKLYDRDDVINVIKDRLMGAPEVFNDLAENKYSSGSDVLNDIDYPSIYEDIKYDFWEEYRDEYFDINDIEIETDENGDYVDEDGEYIDPDEYMWSDDEFFKFIDEQSMFYDKAGEMLWYLWTNVDSYVGDEMVESLIEEFVIEYDDELSKLNLEYIKDMELTDEWEENEYYEYENSMDIPLNERVYKSKANGSKFTGEQLSIFVPADQYKNIDVGQSFTTPMGAEFERSYKKTPTKKAKGKPKTKNDTNKKKPKVKANKNGTASVRSLQEIQSKRSPASKKADAMRKAKKTVHTRDYKGNYRGISLKDGQKWAKNPGSMDIVGVDAPYSKTQQKRNAKGRFVKKKSSAPKKKYLFGRGKR